ncbi:metallophosphoesterase family protein [soil metagenome]
MKALILSDLHSNIVALETIWAQERDSDVVYCTGDLVDYGPYPKDVLDWVRAHKVVSTQGNHDRHVAYIYRTGPTLDALPLAERAWVHYNASLLDEVDIQFLEQLPVALTFDLDGLTYGLTHLYRDYEEIRSSYAYDQFCTQTFPQVSNLNRLILGHTHRQSIHYLSNTTFWANPGSISYRRQDDPDQTAHYLTISDGVLALQRIAYNTGKVYHAVQQISLKEAEIGVAKWFFGPRQSE